ncbi:hypothetical protein MKEN_01452700 [Mycena kentingensis (nom. inval.)]|nr:hypothetical protein MKEN_01452700 [Mycena kentingensis (nom. inval.)]
MFELAPRLPSPRPSASGDDAFVPSSPLNTLGLFGFAEPPALSAASSAHISPAPPRRHTRRQLQHYDPEREGGWMFDALGGTRYVPHGRIEEVRAGTESRSGNSEESDVVLALDVEMDDAGYALPLPPPPDALRRTVPLLPLEVVDNLPLPGAGADAYSAWESTAPKRRRKPLALPVHDYDRTTNDENTKTHTKRTSLTQTRSQEQLYVLRQHITSLGDGCRNVVSLHSKLASQENPDIAALTLCGQIDDALRAVRGSLERRGEVSSAQWKGSQSASARGRYESRLVSLKRTLQKLRTLSAVSVGSLRAHQLTRLRGILEQHRAKLVDLACKFDATLDRLHIRHLAKKWPVSTSMNPVALDEPMAIKWRVEVGAAVGEFLGIGEDAERCVLRSWPDGYGMFFKERMLRNSLQRDFYLYGAPATFRSPKEFIQHAIWLMRKDRKSIEPTWLKEIRRRGRKKPEKPAAHITTTAKSARHCPRAAMPVNLKPTPAAKQSALKQRVNARPPKKVWWKDLQAALEVSSKAGPAAGSKGVQPAVTTVASTKIPPVASRFPRTGELVWYLLDNPIQLSEYSGAAIRFWPALVQQQSRHPKVPRTEYTIRLLASSMVLYTVDEASLLPYMAYEVDSDIKALIEVRVPRFWWITDLEDEGVDLLNATEEDVDAVLTAYAVALEAAIKIRGSWTVSGPFEAPAQTQPEAGWQFQGVWWGPEHIRVGDLVRLNASRDDLLQPLLGANGEGEEEATYEQGVFLKVNALFTKMIDRRRVVAASGAVYELAAADRGAGQIEPLPKPPKGFKFTALLPANEQVELPVEKFVAGRYYPRILDHPAVVAHLASSGLRTLEGLRPGPENAVAAYKYVPCAHYRRVEAVEGAEKTAREVISEAVLCIEDDMEVE